MLRASVQLFVCRVIITHRCKLAIPLLLVCPSKCSDNGICFPVCVADEQPPPEPVAGATPLEPLARFEGFQRKPSILTMRMRVRLDGVCVRPKVYVLKPICDENGLASDAWAPA